MQFDRIIGHAALKARLINNVREGRVPHAQFFLGPRGSGTLPLAFAYARYLLCQDQQAGDSCGVCSSCLMVAKLAHPDLHLTFPIFLSEKAKTCEPFLPEWREAVLQEPYLDAERWREALDGENKQLRMGVDIAAEIARKLNLKAYQGGWKVMLIWLPEFLAPDAANKLLKILEEPEPMTAFLLVGHNNEQMLPTILSRVQLVKVPALDPGGVVEALRSRFPDLELEDARAIAGRSEGDLLEAVEMAGQSEDEMFIFFRDWLRGCYANKVADTVEFAEHFAKMGRERQKTFMRYALYLIRQCVLQWQQVPQLVSTIGQEQEFVDKFSALLNERNADGIRKELETAHGHLERNANPKVLFLDLSYRLGTWLRTKAA
ncbi:MAG TPA: DNA polymerase III subunit delta' [Flavobacteriales bacterium]